MSVELMTKWDVELQELMAYLFKFHAAEYVNRLEHAQHPYPERPESMMDTMSSDRVDRLERICQMHVVAVGNASEFLSDISKARLTISSQISTSRCSCICLGHRERQNNGEQSRAP